MVLEVMQRLQQAMRLAQAQQYSEAAQLAREVLDQDAGATQAHLILGICALAAGDARPAVDHLSRYVASRPEDVNGRFNLAAAQHKAGDLEAAANSYQEILTTHSGLVQVRRNLVSALSALERYEEAADVLENTLQDSDDSSQWLQWGGLLAQAGNAERFELAYRRIQSRFSDPSVLAEAVCHRARFLHASGDIKGAIALLRTKEYAQWPIVLDLLGALLARSGKRTEAIQCAREAVKAQPNSVRFRFNLAALLSRGTDPEQLEEARGLAQALVESNADDHASWHCLGLIEAKTHRHEEASRSLRCAASLRPRELAYGIGLGDFLVQQGRVDEAIEVFDRNLEVDPRHAQSLRQKGIALLRHGRIDEAIDSLRSAEQRAPNDQRVIAHLGLAMQIANPREGQDYLGCDRHVYAKDLAAPAPFADVRSFNRALADDIRRHSLMRWEPIGLAARGGGLTDDLLADDTPAIRGFEKWLRQTVEALIRDLPDDPGDPFLRSVPRGRIQAKPLGNSGSRGGIH